MATKTGGVTNIIIWVAFAFAVSQLCMAVAEILHQPIWVGCIYCACFGCAAGWYGWFTNPIGRR